jgi:surfactin synthase thioesterase subunit
MKVKLLCFPFAGGSKYSYNLYARATPRSVQIIPVEYPGRGARFKETLMTDIKQIVEDCFQRIKEYTSERYAIYGHSMGSVVAYLLTKKIIEHELPPPVHLFVSGRGGPSFVDAMPARSLLAKDKFIEALKVLGGSPEEVLNDDGLMNFFEPIFRADFRALETYQYEDTEPLNIPITLMSGTEEYLTKDHINAWQRETTFPIDFKLFPGNHFFIFNHAAEIMKIITQRTIPSTFVSA